MSYCLGITSIDPVKYQLLFERFLNPERVSMPVSYTHLDVYKRQLHVSFLYVTSDDEIPFDVWQGMIPFSYVMESNEICEDMKCEFTHFIEQLSISLLGNGEIEVKAVLAFHSFFKKPVHLFNIEEITYEPIDIKEVEKRPGIIGYIVQDGDDLWELAKRYSTTMEGIMEVNQMENSDLKSGDKILIFKENMSIL